MKLRSLITDPQKIRRIGYSLLLVLLFAVVGFLAYSFIHRTLIDPPVESERANVPPGQVIQIDLLNGCGVSGAASKFTNYLRARGYDVVEMKNYKTFDVKESLVIDRAGDIETAKRVAYALGVSEKNIIQQINHDYFVDVSVVVGKDFGALKPYRQ
ncbi:MAG: LytR C-terminal domain-containing protein [Ignavibacteriae bacterium]|nr:LytR C-terminal domain-containing protein [Ignavibacteriota bacterium]